MTYSRSNYFPTYGDTVYYYATVYKSHQVTKMLYNPGYSDIIWFMIYVLLLPQLLASVYDKLILWYFHSTLFTVSPIIYRPRQNLEAVWELSTSTSPAHIRPSPFMRWQDHRSHTQYKTEVGQGNVWSQNEAKKLAIHSKYLLYITTEITVAISSNTSLKGIVGIRN